MGDTFDPFNQNVTFLSADGKTPLYVPFAALDAFHDESASVCINYGAQLGACIIMLLVLLIQTPAAKFRRPSTILHIAGLVICSIRMVLLVAWFPSAFNDFYAVWGLDYSLVPRSAYNLSLAANSFSVILVVVIEAALMNQAWTMIRLWGDFWRYLVVGSSAIVTLLTIGWRITFAVFQSRAILELKVSKHHDWVIYWCVITNAISICWFCAIFNLKLVWHIVSNRGMLPSYKTMSPMEVLVMTNGMLMIIPVIFTGLEWADFSKFESASLTLTSVAIILPLGTLAAQRVAKTSSFSYQSAGSSPRPNLSGPSSITPFKAGSFSAGGRREGEPNVSVFAHWEAGMSSRDRMDPTDLKFGRVSTDPGCEMAGHVRVDRDFAQHME